MKKGRPMGRPFCRSDELSGRGSRTRPCPRSRARGRPGFEQVRNDTAARRSRTAGCAATGQCAYGRRHERGNCCWNHRFLQDGRHAVRECHGAAIVAGLPTPDGMKSERGTGVVVRRRREPLLPVLAGKSNVAGLNMRRPDRLEEISVLPQCGNLLAACKNGPCCTAA